MRLIVSPFFTLCFFCFFCSLGRFCELGDLGTLVELTQKNGVPMEEIWIMEVFVQICFALCHLHKACIIHRDLEPGNVFMDKHNTVKVWRT